MYFTVTVPPVLYTRSLHDALPIFHYAYRPLDGDGEVVARVNAVENTNEHAKAGVMIRDSLEPDARDRKSTRLNSSHVEISYAVFCLKKKKDNSHSHLTKTHLSILS